MQRREIDPAELGAGFYPYLTASIVPRPIAWVTTRSAAGVDNLAPHSFFTVVSVVPPVLGFTSVGEKDTLRNARATREFTVSIVSEPLAELANDTATDFPPTDSEYAAAGLAPEPSLRVAPPRVAASPAVFECVYAGEHVFGEGPHASVLVFGEVVALGLDEAVLSNDGLPAVASLQPVSRLGRNEWGALGRVFDLRRVPVGEWQQGERSRL